MTEKHPITRENIVRMDGDKFSYSQGEEQGSYIAGAAVDRLAAYEDTGLKPDEVAALIQMSGQELAELALDTVLKRLDTELAYVQEMVIADKEGRLVVLPLKPGMTVWEWLKWSKRQEVKERVISHVRVSKDGAYFFDTGTTIGFTVGDIGKTVFLTREEAEAAVR